MKLFRLLAIGAALAALPTLAVAEANAQQRPVGGGPRITLPSHTNHFSWERHHGFHGGVFIVEREVPVIIEREVVRETPPPPAAVPLPEQAQGGTKEPRKPYVIGSTYASLPPQGCMKLIEDGASYYFCSGEWYRQLGTGRVAKYRAVARP